MEAVCWCAAQALSHYGRHIGLSRKHSDAHFTVFIHRAEEGAADIRARQLFKKKQAEEHKCHLPGALWLISIRYVEDLRTALLLLLQACCPALLLKHDRVLAPRWRYVLT